MSQVVRLSPIARRFVAFQAVSILGDRIAQVSIPLALLVLTGSPGAAGAAAAANQLPGFLLATTAGAIVDRRSRKSLSVLADVVRAVLYGALAALFIGGTVNVPVVVVVMFVIGVFDTLSGVAHFAWLPTLAKDEELLRANELVEGSDAAVTFVGPPLGGVLLDVVGKSIGVLANGVTFLISAIGLSRLPSDRNAPAASESKEGRPSIVGGFRVIWSDRDQRGLQLMMATTFITTGALVLIVLSLGTEELELGATAAALAVSGAGAGGLLASFLVAPRVRRTSIRTVCIGMYAVVAVSIVGIAVSPHLIGLILGMLFADAAITLTFIVLGSLRQSLTEDELLGTVGGTSTTINALLITVSVGLARIFRSGA